MENSALLTAIIQNALDGIITIDEGGHIESINPSACVLFQYRTEELIGKKLSFLLPDGSKGLGNFSQWGFQDIKDEIVNGTEKKIIGKEITGLKKDRTLFPFRLGISEVQFSGRKVYAGFIHDLSQEKKAEDRLKEYAAQLQKQVADRTQSLEDTVQALQKTKEEVSLSLKEEKELSLLKSRFLSMASHEFRTPLSAVQLSASLIDKYALPLQNLNISKHVGKIKNAVNNLTAILNDFLSLEKLEAGTAKPSFNTFDLVQFSEEIAEEMQLVAKPKQNIIYQHTGIKSEIYLDQNMLRNCIINLITNAIKYSGENTFIDFNTEVSQMAYIITVKDNGMGIPENDQKHLFEAFFRAHNTGNIPGTGLGLSIVARYTHLMNGQIDFNSSVAYGTRFTITFPINEQKSTRH